MRDYYSILNVDKNASQDEIKKAYRRLAREKHPDMNNGETEEEFKEISLAYETLSDPNKKAQVDMGIDPNDPTSGAGFGRGGFSGSPFDMGDIFSSFFGGASGRAYSQRQRPTRGEDELASVYVSLEQLMDPEKYGAEITVKAREFVACDVCGATGSKDNKPPTSCYTCGGSGYVTTTTMSILGQVRSTSPCGTCGGYGKAVANPCDKCRGTGRVRENISVAFKLPAGLPEGTKIKIDGKGSAGLNGTPAGDLYVNVFAKKHKTFARSGSDLSTLLNIPISVATMGQVITMDVLGRETEIKIPAGSQTGDEIKIAGAGLPKTNKYSSYQDHGNLFVKLYVQIPKHLNGKQKKLFESFSESLGKKDKEIKAERYPDL